VPQPPTAGTPVSATVANTWNPTKQQAEGVYAYAGPYSGVADSKTVAMYPENEKIAVRCVITNGRVLKTDPLPNGKTYQSGKWFMLNTPTPSWMPAIYTSLYQPDDSVDERVPPCVQ
jgi:hypothetical protein